MYHHAYLGCFVIAGGEVSEPEPGNQLVLFGWGRSIMVNI